MNTETVDRQFAALQSQAELTASLIRTLADKLTAASATGDPKVREWSLDLKEIALAVRDEQATTTELLQAIHALVDDHVATAPQLPQYSAPAPQYAQPAQYSQPAPYAPAGSGGTRAGKALIATGVGDVAAALATGERPRSSSHTQTCTPMPMARNHR